MLGMLFRGVFLIGILTWYSTNVWKLIDGYFRDQFRNYLEEEYRKNPRMRPDLQAATAAGKADPVAAAKEGESTVAPSREIPETCESSGDGGGGCPVETAASQAREPAREEVTGGTGENETASGSIDKNAFPGTTAESTPENRKSSDDDQESADAVQRRDDRDPRQRKNLEDRRSSTEKRKGKRNARSAAAATPRDIPPREAGTSKKRAVKTITLTERDFVSARGDTSNDDFWEFEEDVDRREPLEGVLVSQLPFSPRIDGIGDLERVTADEYCPLTLEDETSCGETVKWP